WAGYDGAQPRIFGTFVALLPRQDRLSGTEPRATLPPHLTGTPRTRGEPFAPATGPGRLGKRTDNNEFSERDTAALSPGADRRCRGPFGADGDIRAGPDAAQACRQAGAQGRAGQASAATTATAGAAGAAAAAGTGTGRAAVDVFALDESVRPGPGHAEQEGLRRDQRRPSRERHAGRDRAVVRAGRSAEGSARDGAARH